EIEKHTPQRGLRKPRPHDRTEVLEPRMHDGEARVRAEAPTPRCYRFRILVQCEQSPLSAQPLENPGAVSPAPEGRVDVGPVRLDPETLERLLHQHRLMCGPVAHPLRRSIETAFRVL